MGGFLRRHREWIMLITLGAIVLVAAAVISLSVVERVSKGPAFRASAAFIRNDPVARQQLGVITGFGQAVEGGVNESGPSGIADLSFEVDGSWRNARADVVVRKKAHLWLVVSAVIEVDGRAFQLRSQPTPL